MCIHISLNLAGVLTTQQQMIIYLEDSYAAVRLSGITTECTIFLPLIHWNCIENTARLHADTRTVVLQL